MIDEPVRSLVKVRLMCSELSRVSILITCRGSGSDLLIITHII
jgi:hypothetical protein